MAIARAASVLGFSNADWHSLSSIEKQAYRNIVRNADRRIERFAARSPEDRRGANRPEDWSAVDWELYKEELGL